MARNITAGIFFVLLLIPLQLPSAQTRDKHDYDNVFVGVACNTQQQIEYVARIIGKNKVLSMKEVLRSVGNMFGKGACQHFNKSLYALVRDINEVARSYDANWSGMIVVKEAYVTGTVARSINMAIIGNVIIAEPVSVQTFLKTPAKQFFFNVEPVQGDNI